MAANPHYFVWEWLDQQGQPRYVGCAPSRNGEHPADILWDNRANLNSELGRWLQMLPKQPLRNVELPSIGMYYKQAAAISTAERARLRTINVDLLSARPFGTKAGGGRAKAVIDELGDVHESVRAAAADRGIDAATVTRYCSNPKSEWRYV